MNITFISDTHWIIKNPDELQILIDLLPGGPCLVHSGDVSGRGTLAEVTAFLKWFDSLPYTNKIFIAGNHDFYFEVASSDSIQELLDQYPSITYLKDSEIIIDGIKFWGSPYTPEFNNWAFNMNDSELIEHWNKIPDDVDVLITHGPPYNILDKTYYTNENVGCKALLIKLQTIKPQVHVFGHIHEGRGLIEQDGITYINASSVDIHYYPYDRCVYSMNVEPKQNNLV